MGVCSVAAGVLVCSACVQDNVDLAAPAACPRDTVAGLLRRASQLRGVVAELRKVCAYPTLLMEFSMGETSGNGNGGEGDSPAASPRASSVPAATATTAGDADRPPVDLVTASGKLRVLQQLLPALQASGHRVLLLSQSRKVRPVPDIFATHR